MSSSHSHAVPSTRNEKALWIALGLTTAFMLAEVAAGVITGSLALISDAAHMFTDTAALGIALAAIRVAKRPADASRTYGYFRFEILAAAFNALLLFGVAIYILVEAYGRFRSPPEIQTGAMIWVAAFGLAVNLISMRLLSAGKDASLNMKGAYLEVWSDMLGSIGVILGAIAIRFTGWSWIDPLIAVAIGLWVLPRTWTLLRESLNILLEGAPAGIDVSAVAKEIGTTPGVREAHDLHVWALTTGKSSLTAHVVHEQAANPQELTERLKGMLAERFEIFHTTLQMELVPCAHSADGCNYMGERPGHDSHADGAPA
ncbi:MAG: cation diffusion facilitator family transporter [Pseudomonadota bacterium]